MQMRSAVDAALRILQSLPQSAPDPSYTVGTTKEKGFLGVTDRWIVLFEETAPGVFRLSMNEPADRHGTRLAMEAKSEADLRRVIEAWRDKIEWWRGRLSVYRLLAGSRYRVCQSFTDFYGGHFDEDTVLTFVSRGFVPYTGGHTIGFQEATVYLQEEVNAAVLDEFDLYFEEIRPAQPLDPHAT